MSLRVRLITSILVVLLASLGIGGLSGGWTATQSVRTELQAALGLGERTVRTEAAGLVVSDDALAEPSRRLVRLFDGNRHVHAMLVDTVGREQLTSAPFEPHEPAPAWLVRLIAPSLPDVLVPLPQVGTMILRADPWNEVAEVWGQLRGGLMALGVFCLLSTALIAMVVTRALRPLEALAAALATVNSDSFAVRLRPAGAPELAKLAQGFNAMVERLGRAEAQNHRLHEQLVTVQEEERAELARDLHDEVGPFLFCVSIDAAAIEQAARAGRYGEVPVSAAAIRNAVGHMQVHVRAMLERLRPPSPVELGLALSLHNLVTFWQARRPAIAFTLRVTQEEDLDEATKEVVYRVAQEGMTNAVRHGQPGRIEVVIEPCAGDAVLVRVVDDGVGLSGSGVLGFGLTALHERVQAKGGALEILDGPGGRGLEVMARLPRRAPADAAEFVLPP